MAGSRSANSARRKGAREAIDASGRDVVLTGRAEPGLRTRQEVATVVAAVSPLPVNVLLTDPSWMSLDALEAIGVRRISVGSALSRVAWSGFLTAATAISKTGKFDALSNATPFATLNALMMP